MRHVAISYIGTFLLVPCPPPPSPLSHTHTSTRPHPHAHIHTHTLNTYWPCLQTRAPSQVSQGRPPRELLMLLLPPPLSSYPGRVSDQGDGGTAPPLLQSFAAAAGGRPAAHEPPPTPLLPRDFTASQLLSLLPFDVLLQVRAKAAGCRVLALCTPCARLIPCECLVLAL